MARPPLRLLGQAVVAGHEYRVELLAMQPCAAVPQVAVQAALAAAGILGARVTTEPATSAQACRVVGTGRAVASAPVPVSTFLSQVRVPGMIVVSVRDITTGRSLFPDDSGAPAPGPLPQGRPDAPAVQQAPATSGVSALVVGGAVVLVGLALLVLK